MDIDGVADRLLGQLNGVSYRQAQEIIDLAARRLADKAIVIADTDPWLGDLQEVWSKLDDMMKLQVVSFANGLVAGKSLHKQ